MLYNGSSAAGDGPVRRELIMTNPEDDNPFYPETVNAPMTAWPLVAVMVLSMAALCVFSWCVQTR